MIINSLFFLQQQMQKYFVQLVRQLVLMTILKLVAIAFITYAVIGVCDLQNFPTQISSAENLLNSINIDSYVKDHYPNVNQNFTPPIQVEIDYHTIDFSKTFVEGCPYPNFLKTVFGENQVSFELFNLQSETIVNTSSKYNLPKPQECSFFCMDQTNILVSSTLLIQCRNVTHQRDYSIVWFLKNTTRIQQANIFSLDPRIKNIDIYRSVTYQGYPKLNQLFINYRSDEQNVRIDYYSTSSLPIRARSYDDAYYEEIKQKLGITTDLKLVDYKVINIDAELIQLFLDEKEGLLIYYKYWKYRWMVNGQLFLKVITFCQSNHVAVITNKNIYFLAIFIRQVDYLKVVFVEELTKIQNNGYSKEFYSIGDYLVASNSTVWNLHKLIGPQLSDRSFILLGLNADNQKYKMSIISYPFQKSQKDIYIDNSCCKTNSFFSGNKRYVIKSEKIINAGHESRKTIKLKTDVCEKEIVLRRHQQGEIQEVNAKQSIVWWENGTLIIDHEVCTGNNLTKSIIINEKSYPIPQFIKKRLSLSGKIVEFLHLTDNLNAVVTLENSQIKLFRCYNSQCNLIKSLSNSIKKIILRKISIQSNHILIQNPKYNDLSNETAFVFSFLTTTFEIFTQTYLTFQHQINSLGGWQTLKTKIIYDYQLLELRGQSYSSNFKSFFIATGEVYLQNSWTHVELDNSGSSVYQLEDIFINYKKMCSLSVKNCVLYHSTDETLNLALVRDVNGYFIPQRFQNISNLSINNQRTICTQYGLAISNLTSIIFISEELVISHKFQMNQPILDFKVSGKLLLIKKLNQLTEIYNIESGFLLHQLKEVDFDKIITHRQSSFIVLENGTILQLNQKPIFHNVQRPLDYHILKCSNSHNSISKLKNIVIKELNGQLPQSDSIIIPSGRFIDDFWNITISNISVMNGTRWTRQSHFSQIDDEDNYPFSSFEVYINRFEILNQLLYLSLVNNYYEHLAEYDWSYIAIDKGIQDIYYILNNTYKESQTATLFLGFTQVLKSDQTDSITFLSQNMSYFKFDILTFQQNFTKDHKIQNKTVLCEKSTWVPWEYYLQERIFMDGTYVYLLRYQQPQWNTNYTQPKNKNQFILPYRRVISNPKIQIFMANDCKLDEITNQKLGLHTIVDFQLVIRNKQSFIIILTTQQIAILKYPKKQNIFSAKLSHSFVKLDVKQNFLLLISAHQDSQLYQIHWQSIPFPRTLQLETTFAKASYEQVASGVILEGKVILASVNTLYLYHITSKTRSFSVEALSAYELINDQNEESCLIQSIKVIGKDLIEFTIIFYIKTFGGYRNFFKIQQSFNVSSYLNLPKSKQLKAQNGLYQMIYDIKQGKTQVESHLRAVEQQ